MNAWTRRAERLAVIAEKMTEPERPLPTLEEFAAFLFARPDGDAMHAKAKLLHHYAAVWGNVEGIPNGKAQQMADALLDEATMTADERLEQDQ